MTRRELIQANPVMTAASKTTGRLATVYFYDGTFYTRYAEEDHTHAVPGQLTLNLRDFRPYPGIPIEELPLAPPPEQGTQKGKTPCGLTGLPLATLRADYTSLNTAENWGFKSVAEDAV